VTEQSLHNQLKEWYAQPGDLVEATLDDYKVDIIRNDLLIEIQTRNFSAIKSKLENLLKEHKVRLIHPVPYLKWIIRLDKYGKQVSKRRSPKKGRVEEVFDELVYIYKLLEHPNLELEVLLVNMEEYLIDDGRGSWKRRRWSIHDRKLINVQERKVFKTSNDFLLLLPESLQSEFTARNLAKASKLRIRLAQKIVYCLRHLGLLEVYSKKRRANVYRVLD
jgi:hypothetical protein